MLHNGRCEVPDASGVLEFVSFEPFSVEAWVRAPDSVDDIFGFIGNWDGAAGWSLFAFPGSSANGTQPNLEYKRNAAPNIIQCSDQTCKVLLDFSDFRHVVATYDSGLDASLYIDGIHILTSPLTNALLSTETNFSVVGPASTTDFVAFDEVAVYDYALTPAQIQAHFNCGSGNGC